MTKVNLKISVIALAIGMFAVSCGGGQQQSSNAEKAEKAINEQIEQSNKGGGLSKTGEAKLASFGKTEKGKRIVAYMEYKNAYDVDVVSDDNGKLYLEGYKFYFDNESGKQAYEYYVESNKRSIEEKSEDGLWIYPRRLGDRTDTWQEAYDEYKNDGWKIIE